MGEHRCTGCLLSKCPPWDLGTGGGESLHPRRRAEGRWGTVPELRMVGRALGGRDPVKELLLPPRLVPPPLHVSCREESWPGMEMDLAVDGGLGKTEGGVTGAPQLGVRRRQGTPRAWRREESLALPPQCPGQSPQPSAACTSTHVLKQGSPESRNIPMVTCAKAGAMSHAPFNPPSSPTGAWTPCSGFR